MKLGMKFTMALFLAALVGLVCGGFWLRWATKRDVRERARAEAARLLHSMEPSLARLADKGDREALRDVLELAHAAFPTEARLEVTDRRGTRLAGVGLPPPEGGALDAIYKPLSLPDGTLVGAVQVMLDRHGLGAETAHRMRAGGTAVFVALFLTWMVSEVLAALILLSPIKKLHRALKRAAERPGPANLELLREETRTQGKDELDEVVEHTLELLERGEPGQPRLRALESRPPSDPGETKAG